MKRFVAILLALCLTAAIWPAASAATANDSAKSQTQAIAWARSMIGKSVDTDGEPLYQCVDFIQAYFTFLGAEPLNVDGKDYAFAALPEGWKRMQGAAPRAGDILIYVGTANSPYGHVAIYESDNAHYHQNFNNHAYVEKVTYGYDKLTNPYWGVIRPDLVADYIPAPVIKKIANTTSGVQLTWGKAAGAEKYRVYRKSGSGSWTRIGDTAAVTYTDSKAVSNTLYTYTVRCISADGTKNTSDYDPTGMTILYYAAPRISKIENAYTGPKITWAKVAGASKYRVYVKNDSEWKALATTASASYIHTAAKSNTSYTYTVRGLDGSGSLIGAYDTVGRTNKYHAPAKISGITNTVAGAKITWAKVAGASKYRVYVKNGSEWKALATTASASYTHTAVKSGAAYTYTVRCLDSKGSLIGAYHTGGWKNQFIAAPALPTLTNTKSGVQITFKKVTGAAKYRIFRKTGSGEWKRLADTTALKYVDKTAKNKTKYSYTVRCISKDGKTYTSAYNTAGKAITCKR